MTSSQSIGLGTSRVQSVSPPEFIPEMCPLLAGMASPKSEVCHHYDPIHPSLVDQCQQLCHLLHPIGTRSLRSLGIAHGNLINVACHIVFPLLHVEPSVHPIFHISVQRGGDVLANHPIPKLQVRTAYDPRSRSPWAFKQKKWWKRSKCERMPR